MGSGLAIENRYSSASSYPDIPVIRPDPKGSKEDRTPLIRFLFIPS